MKSLWTFFFFFNAQITIAFMLKYNPQKMIKIRPRKSSLELAFCVLIKTKICVLIKTKTWEKD
jgi:hypothetical protein